MSWCARRRLVDEKQLSRSAWHWASSTLDAADRRRGSLHRNCFGNGLKLAANRGLMERGSNEQRLAFARQLAEVLDRIDRIAALAAARRSRIGGTSA